MILHSVLCKWFIIFLSKIRKKLLDFLIFHYIKKIVIWNQKKDQNRYKNFTIGKKSYYITLILGKLKFLGWYSKDWKTFIFAKKNH